MVFSALIISTVLATCIEQSRKVVTCSQNVTVHDSDFKLDCCHVSADCYKETAECKKFQISDYRIYFILRCLLKKQIVCLSPKFPTAVGDRNFY